MRLLFKQRMFSWLDSYDIYGESGDIRYSVKGQLAWGHCLKIFDADGKPIGMVKQRIFSFLPKFEIYLGENYVGCIKREFTFFKPRFTIDCNGWQVDGNFFEWDYSIKSASGEHIATVSKELFNWTDTYIIDVRESSNAVMALMLVLAIDAEKCSRENHG